MFFLKFQKRQRYEEDTMFLPTLGFPQSSIGLMKFICTSEEMKIYSKTLQKMACKICPNKVKYIVGECDSSSSKLYGNGVFCCYHPIRT